MTEIGKDAKYLPGTRIIDIRGQRYGRLIVVAFSHREKATTWFDCRCDCGNMAKVSAGKLHNGQQKSCGCLRHDILIERNTTHGKTNTRTYRIYRGMLNRCNNVNYGPYPDYGGRGIRVCDEWSTFEGFLCEMGECPPGLTLERVDNNGPYSKANCIWGTRREQARNRRSNHMVEFNGRKQCISAWEQELGFKEGTLKARLQNGWPVERAITTRVMTLREVGLSTCRKRWSTSE